MSGVETESRMGARGTSCPQKAPCFLGFFSVPSHDSTVWTKATFLLAAGDQCCSGSRLSLGSVECMQTSVHVSLGRQTQRLTCHDWARGDRGHWREGGLRAR